MSFTNNPQESPEQNRIKQTQSQVDEVVSIMRMNVEKVMDRGQNLSELDERATLLQQSASQFEVKSAKLRRKYWWQNYKMKLILCAIGVFIVLIIGLSLYSSYTESQGRDRVTRDLSVTASETENDKSVTTGHVTEIVNNNVSDVAQENVEKS